MHSFSNRRDAAAWMIRQGRALINCGRRVGEFMPVGGPNATHEMGFSLVLIGKRIAMGPEYENQFGEPTFTDEIYKAHVRATRPGSRRHPLTE